MNEYEMKFRKFLEDNHIQGEHLIFEESCHSVEDAAKAADATVEDCVKNICMIGVDGNLIVAIVKGEDRASTKRVAKALNTERPRTATPDEILKKTGYPCGGTPSFGYDAIFLIDPKVMEMDVVFSGGGSDHALLKISTKEMQKVNNGKMARVRK